MYGISTDLGNGHVLYLLCLPLDCRSIYLTSPVSVDTSFVPRATFVNKAVLTKSLHISGQSLR